MRKAYILSMVLALSLVLATVLSAEDPTGEAEGIEYRDLVVGEGLEADSGMIATVHLAIWLNENGQKGDLLFDSRTEREKPISFKLGTRRFIDALDLGVPGMREGGKRILYIPSGLNLEVASGPFPANADLIFEVELVSLAASQP